MTFRLHFKRLALRYLAAVGLLIATVPALADPTEPSWRSLDRAAASIPSIPASLSSDASPEGHEALRRRLMDAGQLPVIVRLRQETLPEATLSATQQEAQRVALAEAQQTLLTRLTSGGAILSGIKRFSLASAVALQVDGPGLEDLLADPMVLDVTEDVAVPLSLSDSLPLIGADVDQSFGGRTGLGQVVAVLDTGVASSHPFLSGKVVSEACYSSTIQRVAASLCPRGVAESTATGSALDCDMSLAGCGHGTHVAGIAAGRGDAFSGVARDAGIIAIKVFSRLTPCPPAPFDCVTAYVSDIIKGLERVYALRNSFNVASVNLSLGGGQFSGACDTLSPWSLMKDVVDQLRAAGIATVVASGNEGYSSATSAPACLSTVVSVGNTTKEDSVNPGSNSADFLALLAPGTRIRSSVPARDYAVYTGTSMAAPHVAGAWAVLKEAKPTALVDQVLQALVETGIPVTDTRAGAGGRSKPRIQVDQALARLIADPDDADRLDNGVPISGLAGVAGRVRHFTFEVPPGAKDLEIRMSGGSGDADLYVRYGSPPTLSEYDCRPFQDGNNEVCPAADPSSGLYYIMIHGYAAYSGVTLSATYAVPPLEHPFVSTPGGYANSAASARGVVVATTLNAANQVVVFIDEQGHTDWSARVLSTTLVGPSPSGMPVAFVDPKDDRIQVAYPSASGLMLYQREPSGVWGLRNLTSEVGGGASTISRQLTWLVSPPVGGDYGITEVDADLISLVGVNPSGQLVKYAQRREGTRVRWEYVNLTTRDLEPRGQPALGWVDEPVGYTTPWNGQNVAGLNAAGQVVVAWSGGPEGVWSVTRLSDFAPTPVLAGGLSAYINWGINLTGVLADGRLGVTWWSKAYEDQQAALGSQRNWAFNVLSDPPTLGPRPRLRGASAVGLTTPNWTSNNIYGIAQDTGHLVAYWWGPQPDQWYSTDLNERVSNAEVPAGRLSGVAVKDSTISVFGVNARGEVLRFFWKPDVWRFENLSAAVAP